MQNSKIVSRSSHCREWLEREPTIDDFLDRDFNSANPYGFPNWYIDCCRKILGPSRFQKDSNPYQLDSYVLKRLRREPWCYFDELARNNPQEFFALQPNLDWPYCSIAGRGAKFFLKDGEGWGWYHSDSFSRQLLYHGIKRKDIPEIKRRANREFRVEEVGDFPGLSQGVYEIQGHRVLIECRANISELVSMRMLNLPYSYCC